ncbi:MAG: flavodoxin [Bacteroidota bacterium]
MKETAIFFGSSTGNTENASAIIAESLQADMFNVADNPADEMSKYKNLIFGASTWGIGDLQDDWETFISEVEKADLNGKVVAIFGLGDADAYPDSFVDAMGTIYNAIRDKGCKLIGMVDSSEYNFDESTALVDGKFVGLPLDDDNESNLTNQRIEKWVAQLKQELS